MASFTDTTPQTFTPYVPKVNLELEARNYEAEKQVGIHAQQQYNENAQKIQGVINTIGGIQVMNEPDKQYLNEKMSELQKNLQTLASSDIGKQAILNQAGAFAAKIYNDKIIQNAESSTRFAQDGLAQIQKAHAEGKSSASNDNAVMRNIKAYQASTTPGATLGKQTYTQYYNYNKTWLDFMKQAHPDIEVTQDPFSKDANGNPDWKAYALVNGKRTELSQEKVQQLFSTYLATDQQAATQVGLDALYYSDNTDTATAFASFESVKNDQITAYIKAITSLEAQKALKNGDDTDISSQIAALNGAINKTKATLSDRQKEFLSNPESAKMSLYRDNLISNMGRSFAYSQREQTVVANPIYKADLDERRFRLSQDKFAWDKDMDKKKLAAAERQAKATEMMAGGITETGTREVAPTPQEVEASIDRMGMESYQEKLSVLYSAWQDSPTMKGQITVGTKSDGSPLYRYNGDPKFIEQVWSKVQEDYNKDPNAYSPIVNSYFANPKDITRGIGRDNYYQAKKEQIEAINKPLLSEYTGKTSITISEPNVDQEKQQLEQLKQRVLQERPTSAGYGIPYIQKGQDGHLKLVSPGNGREISNKEYSATSQSKTYNLLDNNQVVERYNNVDITIGDLKEWANLLQKYDGNLPTTTKLDTSLSTSKLEALVAVKGRNDIKQLLSEGIKPLVEELGSKKQQAYNAILNTSNQTQLTVAKSTNTKAWGNVDASFKTIARGLDASNGGSYYTSHATKALSGKNPVMTGYIDQITGKYTLVASSDGQEAFPMEVTPQNALSILPGLGVRSANSGVSDMLEAKRTQPGTMAFTGYMYTNPPNTQLKRYKLRYGIMGDSNQYFPKIQYSLDGGDWKDMPTATNTYSSPDEAVQAAENYFKYDDIRLNKALQ